jgi:hypothetical protein
MGYFVNYSSVAQSSRYLYLHHVAVIIEVEVVVRVIMRMRVSILTVFAITELRALETGTIALAISFLAHGFFARASSGWNECGYSFKMTRMSIIGDHFSLINLVLVKSCIMTT